LQIPFTALNGYVQAVTQELLFKKYPKLHCAHSGISHLCFSKLFNSLRNTNFRYFDWG